MAYSQSITPDSFALLCFLVLMENGDGVYEKAPSYISEKTWMLRAGVDAFGALDINNMRHVVNWCEKWHVELPARIREEWERQVDAAESLRNAGIIDSPYAT